MVVADEYGVWGVVNPRRYVFFSNPEALADLFHGGPDGDFPHLHTDHSLAIALDRMGTKQDDRALPVVSRANVRQLLGYW